MIDMIYKDRYSDPWMKSCGRGTIWFARWLTTIGILALVYSHVGCEIKTDKNIFPEPDKSFSVRLGQRQLFLDDFGIEEITNLSRKMHQPEKQGLILKPDIPSDGEGLQIFSAPMWDQEEDIYKLVYAAYPKERDQIGSALAVSKDGIHWEKPILGQKSEWPGSLNNNRFAVDLSLRFGENRLIKVVYDSYDPDSSQRYKGFLGNRVHQPVVSPDCINWRKLDVSPLVSKDAGTLGFDEENHLFMAFLKFKGKYGRSYNLSLSKDFVHWTKQRFCFALDEEDQRTALEIIRNRLADPGLANPLYVAPDPATGWQAPEEIRHIDTWRAECYNMGVFRYEGLYIGTILVYYPTGVILHQNRNTDGFNHIQLIMSRDLQSWMRLGERRPFIEPSRIDEGLVGVWDRMQLGVTNHPLLRNDQLFFYYNGDKMRCNKYQYNPDGTLRDPSTLTPEEKADMEEGRRAIHLAVLRRDGFVSLDASDEMGTVLTKPFRLPSQVVCVNVDADGGELHIEVLDDAENIVATSDVMRGDLQHGKVVWMKDGLSSMVGETIRFRFKLRNGSLYSYWFDTN
jgi:hypothetical protein